MKPALKAVICRVLIALPRRWWPKAERLVRWVWPRFHSE
jgi:hypothetical protein